MDLTKKLTMVIGECYNVFFTPPCSKYNIVEHDGKILTLEYFSRVHCLQLLLHVQ